MEKFVVSSSPFIKKSLNSNTMFIYTALAVFACIFAGFINYGIDVLWIFIVSTVSALASEFLFNLIVLKKYKIDNYSFLVTSLILCATLPINVPLYIVAICNFISIFAIKLCFGGLGKNLFNPALIGRLFAGFCAIEIGISFDKFEIRGQTFESVLSGGENSLSNLVMGKGTFGIGTGFLILILVCLVFLIVTGVIDYKIPLISILSFAIVAYSLFGLEKMFTYLISGSFLFVAIFMLTDPNTSPNSFIGKILYSIIFGVGCAFCFKVGLLGENSVFVVALVVNILAPIFDKYLVLKPLSKGGSNNAR